eukprot:TRINITY_DN7310_c0_g1_i8.p1 TRINITY_DN7310_c0_g1~~TRINITY_DN7310_c0_g1_i8.p1  ORF type:complete len:155 (-),score=16.60 TRINITY_DN7310_c0_g1_i8:118-582(-)
MKVVVGLTIGTQVSYTNMVFATALKEASFDGSRHLFSCVPLTSNLTLWVFDCSDHEECGGPWGVPGTLSPSYSSTLSTWSSLAEDKDVFIKGEHNDPRYLVMSYTKSSGETSKVGLIVAVIFVSVVLLAVIVAVVYWLRLKKRRRTRTRNLDRV